jgi:ABC-type phosphate/phosphonate transport system permease subunit
MSSYADREIVVSGFTLAVVAVFVGCIVQFSRHGALNHFFGYALVACGVVLLFLCHLARTSRGYATLLRTLLMVLAGLLLAGVLLKDAIEKLV